MNHIKVVKDNIRESVSAPENFSRVIEHPLADLKLADLKNEATSCHQFRSIMDELSEMICYEALRDIEKDKISKEALMIVPIMRAGTGMLNGLMRTLPDAKVGHIGIYRDKFINNTVEYYFRLPKKTKGMTALLLDPILATGATAVAAISRLKDHGVENVFMLSLMVSRPGLDLVYEFYPDTKIYSFSLIEKLDENGFLFEGLGDVGQRLYGA